MSSSLWVAALAAAALIVYLAVRARANKARPKQLPPGLDVRLTTHARERMALRGVSEAQVMEVLADPTRALPDPVENSVRLERDYDGRVLKVWVAQPWPAPVEVVVKSTAWHYTTSFCIPVGRIGPLLGRGGTTIARLRAETGARINVNNDGTVHISGDDKQTVEHARQQVTAIVGADLGSRTVATHEGR